ncbi:MAG: endonuclease III [Planctomycetota bacterium]|nr:MAG: endonuclease III [Planctomycetota bacterium]
MAGRKKIKVDAAVAKQRVQKIFPILKKTYPDAGIALHHDNAFELLIATILSAQCTDVRVNIVTRDLFVKYKGPGDFLKAKNSQIEDEIRSTGFYRNKARNIQKCCRMLVEEFDGVVPRTMEELTSLPGVGRKTANVILGNAFDTPGITCDTHVIRLSRRLGLSENADPVKLEFDLMEIVPKRKWGGWSLFSHLLIWHGRNICKARKPDCPNCPIAPHCPAANRPELW